MCVIAIADEVRPTEEQVGKMFEANPAGAGIAWREKGVVRWVKGLELADVTKLCAEVPLPYVVHFRIPSTGGKTPYLCHPFPVEKTVPLDLKGTTKGYVLFHNGHWGRWREMTLEAAVRSNTPVPSGKWSDTRAMAFNAHIYGPGVLELIDEKAVLFGPTKVEVFGGWSKEGDLWVSNKGWCSSSFRVTDRRSTNLHWEGHIPHGHQRALPSAQEENGTADVAVGREGPAQRVASRIVRRRGKTAPQVPEGVDLDQLPFDQIVAMFEKEEISKNQFKKQRNRYEAQQRRSKKERLLVH